MDNKSWQKRLKESICTVEQLREYIELTPKEEKQIEKIIQRHPMQITPYYMSLVNRYDPDDPIRKIAIPSREELDIEGSYDTSDEKGSTKMPGLQHKYPSTALILATNRCAVYCRHCFRKRLIGLPSKEILNRFKDAVKYIEKHKEINNVLITGGDPLVLPTKLIRKFLERITTVTHLDFIRFGTKVPVTFPGRILEDNELLTLFKKYSLKDRRIYIVTQFDHPKEITKKSTDAVSKLIEANTTLINQTVLLKGVNDNPNDLAELQSKLCSIGINPYYVFQCRPVKRVKHKYQVPLVKGFEIVEKAKRTLSGPSKRFRYIMAHQTGKIEIIGVMEDYMYFKYHHAKSLKNRGRFFRKRLDKNAGWLDELK